MSAMNREQFEALAELAERYLLDELSPAELEQLERLIQADPEAAQAMLGFMRQAGVMREVFAEQDRFKVRVGEMGADRYLTMLQSLKPTCPIEAVELAEQMRDVARQRAQEPAGLSRYRLPLAVGVGLAAVLALAVTLVVVFQGDPGSPERIVVAPQWESPQPQPQAVATLTAESDARWTNGNRPVVLSPGDTFQAGQRLTLTKGLAEITTQRGALVLLEAPCTIELLDQDNALRLHRGKLVGHCPTRQSKGFTVHTASTQVIDLGTEFGVEAAANGQTSVYVFDGLVALAEPEADTRTAAMTQLATGQGQQIDAQGRATQFEQSKAVATFVRSIDPAQRYEDLVLVDRPLVYYRFEQIIGGVERNVAADRYHAKVFGGVGAVTQGKRSSYSFNKFGDYLETTEPINELRGAESYTIECWVRTARNDYGAICSVQAVDQSATLSGLAGARLETTPPSGQIGPANRFRFVHGSVPDDQPIKRGIDNRLGVFSDTPYTNREWTHLAAVKSGDQLILYVNGVAEGQAEETSPLLDMPLMIKVGKLFGNRPDTPAFSRQFLGQIDELAIYPHALTVEQVQSRVKAGRDWLDE